MVSKLQTLNMTGCWPKLLLQQITRNAKSEENVLNENIRNWTNKEYIDLVSKNIKFTKKLNLSTQYLIPYIENTSRIYKDIQKYTKKYELSHSGG